MASTNASSNTQIFRHVLSELTDFHIRCQENPNNCALSGIVEAFLSCLDDVKEEFLNTHEGEQVARAMQRFANSCGDAEHTDSSANIIEVLQSELDNFKSLVDATRVSLTPEERRVEQWLETAGIAQRNRPEYCRILVDDGVCSFERLIEKVDRIPLYLEQLGFEMDEAESVRHLLPIPGWNTYSAEILASCGGDASSLQGWLVSNGIMTVSRATSFASRMNEVGIFSASLFVRLPDRVKHCEAAGLDVEEVHAMDRACCLGSLSATQDASTRNSKGNSAKKGHRRTKSEMMAAAAGSSGDPPPFNKHPCNGYMFFMADRKVFESLKEEYPDAAVGKGQLRALGSERWRRMTDEEKEPYLELSRKDKDRYREEKRRLVSLGLGGSTSSHTPTASHSTHTTSSKTKTPTSSSSSSSSKKKAGESGPRKPIPAFLYFLQEERVRILPLPDPIPLPNGEFIPKKKVSELAGMRWRDMTPEDKLPYYEMSRMDTERFMREKELFDQGHELPADSFSI